MTTPYTTVSIINYNNNPPTDDAAQTATNKISWDKHKTKLGDPVKTLSESINTNILAAFGKTLDGSTPVAHSTDYTATSADQGVLIVMTSASTVLTTPDAATVTTPQSARERPSRSFSRDGRDRRTAAAICAG